MLEEAVEVIRLLWDGGVKDFEGDHYTVENAEIYTLPDEAPPIAVSGFGPTSAALAGRIGDGFVSTIPDPELLSPFRASGGDGKPTSAGTKVCWGTEEAAARRTAHRLWANEQLPGELAQVLPTTRHIEQTSSLVTEEMVGRSVPCGPDVERHVAALRRYVDAGYDRVYVQQIGPDQERFFDVYAREVLPELRS